MASLTCAMVWSFWPLIRMVQEYGFLTCSTKVYFSSPNTCSYTRPAHPRHSGTNSSTALTATPPQHSTRRSMFLFLARRSPMMPSRDSISKEIGSIPFWLRTTKFFSGCPSQTFFFNAMTARTRSSVNLRSAATNFSRWAASEYMNPAFTSDLSYSSDMLQVRMKQFSACFFISGCLAPWSSTRPCTKRVSEENLCFMCMSSTMCKSTAPSSPSGRTQRTASATMSVKDSAVSSGTLVDRAVRATQRINSRSISLDPVATSCLNVSKNSRVATFANSKPSTNTRG
mmetsp:Transcript_6069/g.8219  ORF Transcript_6069/g.8219 Transcript_6069/m.8219 type:complete len:285 (-) Transcript_6069:448-1302(-)